LAAEHYWTGRWDQAVQIADAELAGAASGARHMMKSPCYLWRGRIRLAKGQVDAALDDSERALELAREAGDRQNLDPALAFAARVLFATGRADEAARLTDELLATLPGRPLNPDLGIDLTVDLISLDRRTEALDQVLASRWLEAAQSFVGGDPKHAADIYAAIGSRPDEAYARLEAARQLMVAGTPIEANTELAIALAFYREAGADADLAEAKQLLATMLSSN
jgi:tetratricopeptide (TPR) repeat protein